MKPTTRKQLAALIRYAVCALAITWLVTHTDWHQLKQVLMSADWSLAALGLLTLGPAPLMLGVRLRFVLAVHHVNLSMWHVIKTALAGNFIVFTLPVGTSGGDAVKTYYLARETPHKHEAVASVVFDRSIGVAGLVAMAGIVSLFNWGDPVFAYWGRAAAVAAITMVVIGSIYFSARMRALIQLDRMLSKLPFSDHVLRLDRAAYAFRGHSFRVLGCLLLTFVLQFFAIISVFLTGWALDLVGGDPWAAFPVYLGYTPICFMAGALPIGVMEEVFNQLFVDAAHLGTREAAYSVSLLARVFQIFWALPGGLVVLKAGRPKNQMDELDMQPATETMGATDDHN
jgi:hypothetical protein